MGKSNSIKAQGQTRDKTSKLNTTKERQQDAIESMKETKCSRKGKKENKKKQQQEKKKAKIGNKSVITLEENNYT